jgi:hypothetical protein
VRNTRLGQPGAAAALGTAVSKARMLRERAEPAPLAEVDAGPLALIAPFILGLAPLLVAILCRGHTVGLQAGEPTGVQVE